MSDYQAPAVEGSEPYSFEVETETRIDVWTEARFVIQSSGILYIYGVDKHYREMRGAYSPTGWIRVTGPNTL